MQGTAQAASGGQAEGTPKAAKLEFEVASVRQDKGNNPPHSTFSLDNGNVYFAVDQDDVLGPSGGYFSASNFALVRFIIFAYNLPGTQELALRFNYWPGLSSNAPEWVKNDHFDIEARAEGKPTKDQVRQMMRSLLEDRFKLAVHTETRQASVFALVLEKPGKTGPHLQPHPADDSCTATATGETPGAAAPAAKAATRGELPVVCGVIAHLPPSAPGRARFGGRGVTMAMLASSLPTQTGMATLPRPVFDETGLSGTFDFSLEWALEQDGPGGQPNDSGPSFLEALEDQFGMKLVPQKGPVDVMVIDHVEHPTEN